MAVDPISFSKLLKKTDDIYEDAVVSSKSCLLYTYPSPRDKRK